MKTIKSIFKIADTTGKFDVTTQLADAQKVESVTFNNKFETENEITIEPKALQQLLDSVLTALLPSAQPGVLRLSSKLTMQHFILSLDLNGTINELRIPIYGDF